METANIGQLASCKKSDAPKERKQNEKLIFNVQFVVYISSSVEFDSLTKLFVEGYNSIYTSSIPNLNVIKDDPDEDKFLKCAVELDSNSIISEDKHLKEIEKYINIDIISPGDFLEFQKRKNGTCY